MRINSLVSADGPFITCRFKALRGHSARRSRAEKARPMNPSPEYRSRTPYSRIECEKWCSMRINCIVILTTLSGSTLLCSKQLNKGLASNVIDRNKIMKKVVLFKSSSEDYERVFSDNDYEAVFVEPLQFEFVNLPHLSQELQKGHYQGLVLTSPRAIEAVSECWSPSKFISWSSRRVYTVGEVSSRKIKHMLGLDSLGETTGHADNLAKLMASENPDSSQFLFPCGNLRSEILPNILHRAGMTVEALTVYKTKENEHLRQKLMDLNENINPCCMVFFSPSGCEYIYRQLQTFSNNLSVLPHFAIGNSTAHKIENLGVEIAGVAAKPKPECVLESVQSYFRTLGECT
ncbi:unnamed protein product [Leptosia nina]|uniref:Uroporphyrinogen-III synthase n=1 Tax=Leptosia nina TaxID=320188 RepID=A0AAV1JYC3_9NEOP